MMFLRCSGRWRGGICEWTLLLCGLVVLALKIPAAATPLGSEFQINSFTSGTQAYPDVAAGAGGDFVVVWESFGQDGDYFGVLAQRYSSGGAAIGTEFQVNSYTTGFQLLPVLTPAVAAGFVVVWQSADQDGSGFGIFGRRHDATGAAVGSEFRINAYTTEGQSDPSVAQAANGDFVVVWSSDAQDAGGSGVFGQRFASSGTALGTEFRVNTYTTAEQATPAVAMSMSGDFVVVWASLGQDGSGDGVFGQRYASSGAAAGSEFQANTYTSGRQDAPAVAAAENGNFVVAWQSYEEDGDNDGVFAQRYGSSGSRLGSEFQVNTYTTEVQSFPDVGLAASGDMVVTWESFGQDGDALGMFGQRYASSGVRLGTEFQVNTYTAAQQSHGGVGVAASGNFVAVWASSPSQDGSGVGVFGQRFDTASCPAAADPECRVAGKGLLLVKPGKIVVKFLNGPALTQTDFGNPLVSGGTAYDLCMYGEDGARVGTLSVARAGETTCGGATCWKPTGGDPPAGKGYKYKDTQLAAAGMKQIIMKGGAAGASKALLKAFPTGSTGIAAALQGSDAVTIQLRGSDAPACFTATLTDIKQSDGTTFKAK